MRPARFLYIAKRSVRLKLLTAFVFLVLIASVSSAKAPAQPSRHVVVVSVSAPETSGCKAIAVAAGTATMSGGTQAGGEFRLSSSVGAATAGKVQANEFFVRSGSPRSSVQIERVFCSGFE